VIRRQGFTTTFLCTNIGRGVVDIGVHVFDATGTPLNDFSIAPAPGACNGAALNVPPGGTVSIATTGTAQLHEDCIIGMGSLRNGSARIFINSKPIARNALVIDRTNVVEDPATGPTGKSPAVPIPQGDQGQEAVRRLRRSTSSDAGAGKESRARLRRCARSGRRQHAARRPRLAIARQSGWR
jgi:hypothetical protein